MLDIVLGSTDKVTNKIGLFSWEFILLLNGSWNTDKN